MLLHSSLYIHQGVLWSRLLPRYSEVIKVHVHRHMIPLHLQSVAANSLDLGIYLNTLYKWR